MTVLAEGSGRWREQKSAGGSPDKTVINAKPQNILDFRKKKRRRCKRNPKRWVFFALGGEVGSDWAGYWFVFQLTDAKAWRQFSSCLQEISCLFARILGQIFAHLNLISCMSRCVVEKNTQFNEDKGQTKTLISIKLGAT